MLSEELSSAQFGDKRLRHRLGVIVDTMALNSAESFPKAAGSTAALEATYRFLGNPSVRIEAILDPHLKATAERCLGLGTVLVVHDTSEFSFPGEKPRAGLGRLRTKGQGFFGHFALALDSDESRRPLGVLGVSTIFRTDPPKGKQSFRKRHETDSESDRWGALVEEVENRLNGRASAVHVMDREADIYDLLVTLVEKKRRFVIRGQHDRSLLAKAASGGRKHKKISEALAQTTGVFERLVPLSRRKKAALPVQRKVHPPREARVARLCFAAETVELKRPGHLGADIAAFVEVNVVHVWEIDTPEGADPVEWRLYTTEPIDTPEAVMRAVDIYRARWTIEEYFKALKTGCAYEKRQLEGKHSLLNALAVFIPIAWRLLLLRTLARSDADAPATTALPAKQVEILVVLSKGKLDARPTVRAAMLQIAALGGHIRNNGEPGWQVLARGYEDLLLIERWEIVRTAGG